MWYESWKNKGKLSISSWYDKTLNVFCLGDATLQFEVEVISLLQQTPWQKMVNDVLPLVCLFLVPTLLGLVGLYLYKKANVEKPSKKKAKDKKSKKK